MKRQSLFISNSSLCRSGYTGFINISGDGVYKSDIYQNEKLDLYNVPYSLVLKSQFFTDWANDLHYTLPYDLTDILLQPNEHALAHVINKTFEKLYTNLEYILSRCYFYTNTIPTEYTGWFGCALIMNDIIDDEDDVTYYVTEYQFNTPDMPCYRHMPCRFATINGIKTDADLETGVFSNSLTAVGATNGDPVSAYYNADNTLYDGIFKIINAIKNDGDRFCIMCTNSALLFKTFRTEDNKVICEDYTHFKILSSVQNMPFANVTSVDISDKKKLYVADAATSNIYQFDLKYIINNDSVIKTPILLNIIGGGDQNNNSLYKIGNIDFLKCSGEYVFIYDSKEHNFLIFDEYLNFNKYIANIGFKIHKPVDVTYRPLFKEYYILCEDGYMIVTDDNMNVIRTYQLDDINNCTGIAASICDSNVYYITTDTQMMQKLFNNNKTVGYFELKKLKIVNDNNLWWSSTDTHWIDTRNLWGGDYNFSYVDSFYIKSINVQSYRDDNGPQDDIWLFANDGRIVMLKNDIRQVELISNMSELKFNKQDLVISEQSYVQAFTYNTLIRKFIDLLSHIITYVDYVPNFAYNSSGNLVYTNKTYIVNKPDINSLLKDLKIYNNDLLSTDIVNRVLTGLFTIEQQMLDMITPKVTNTKYQLFNDYIINI